MHTLGGAEHSFRTEHGTVPGKLVLWLTGAATVVILAAIVIWLYFLNRSWVHPQMAMPVPPVTSKESTGRAAASTAGPAATANPVSKVPVPPAEVPRETRAPFAAPPAALGEKRAAQIVSRLQQERPPATCADGEERVKRKANVSAAQARDIAKRAYPGLCAPAVAATEPAAPRESGKAARSIDQAFKQRAAAECEEGLFGIICQEKIRHTLCDGRWSTTPVSGQKICLQPEPATY